RCRRGALGSHPWRSARHGRDLYLISISLFWALAADRHSSLGWRNEPQNPDGIGACAGVWRRQPGSAAEPVQPFQLPLTIGPARSAAEEASKILKIRDLVRRASQLFAQTRQSSTNDGLSEGLALGRLGTDPCP